MTSGRVRTPVETVRALFAGSGYSAAGIAALGIDVGMGVRAIDVPLLERALEPVEPLATLVRLFVLGRPVAAREVATALGPRAAEALVHAGLAETAATDVRPTLRVTPWRNVLVAHDPDPSDDLWADHVSGPTPAAETLIRLVSPNGGSALDLGTGAGPFALVLASGQSDVTATDLSPAALRLAEINLGLNDIANVRLLAGDLFEPVGDARFDLIVSNPPFVISPETDLLFRHSRYGRDEISRNVVRSAALHLREGGTAYALVNWVHTPGTGWLDAVRGWLVDTGCDVLALLHGIEDPLAYAVRWTAREQLLRPDRHGETLDRWTAHFRREGIEAIGSGAVVIRRRTGRNWTHGIELRGDTTSEAGSHVEAIIAGQDVLAGIDGERGGGDRALLGSAFRMREPHRLTQTLASRGGDYIAEPATLRLESGLGLSVEMPNELVQVVLRLDGSQTAADIAADVSAATGSDAAPTGAQIAAFLRQLLAAGMVEPVLPAQAPEGR